MAARFGFRHLTMAILASIVLSVCVSPALAQDAAGQDIDAIIDASTGSAKALAFARTQAGQGDLLGAAATLERALFDRSAPVPGDVRAYYITILCKLDDRQRALTEVGKLGRAKVSPSAWAETQQACGPLPRPAPHQQKLAATLAMGIAYDSDALGALNQFFSVPGFRVPASDGASFIASLSVDARHPAGTGFLYGGLDAATKDSISGSALNYQLLTARAGYGLSIGNAELSFGPVASYGRIQNADFVGEVGGQARLSWPSAGSGRFALASEIVYQNYVGSQPLLSRDGTRYDLAFSYQHSSNAGLIYTLGAAAEYKTAQTDYLGYAGGRLFAALRAPLNDRGLYTSLSGTVRHIVYRDQPFVGKQIETRYFARAAIGLPVGINGIDVEAAGSYTRRDYNFIYLQNYTSVGVELRLIWKFGK
jgi:hypothetical protein